MGIIEFLSKAGRIYTENALASVKKAWLKLADARLIFVKGQQRGLTYFDV